MAKIINLMLRRPRYKGQHKLPTQNLDADTEFTVQSAKIGMAKTTLFKARCNFIRISYVCKCIAKALVEYFKITFFDNIALNKSHNIDTTVTAVRLDVCIQSALFI